MRSVGHLGAQKYKGENLSKYGKMCCGIWENLEPRPEVKVLTAKTPKNGVTSV